MEQAAAPVIRPAGAGGPAAAGPERASPVADFSEPPGAERGTPHQPTDLERLLDVLQASVYAGCEPLMLAKVVAFCQAAGLDPLLKPVHVAALRDRETGQLVPTIVPGIGLYRTIAARCGCAGIDEPEFGPEVTEAVGGHTITYPHWCRLRVHRRLAGGPVVTFTAKEYWSENVALQPAEDGALEPTEVWRRRPFGQLAKCTEAQALRKAFPEIGAQPVWEELDGKLLAPAAPAASAAPAPLAMPMPLATPPAAATAPTAPTASNPPVASAALTAAKPLTASEPLAASTVPNPSETDVPTRRSGNEGADAATEPAAAPPVSRAAARRSPAQLELVTPAASQKPERTQALARRSPGAATRTAAGPVPAGAEGGRLDTAASRPRTLREALEAAWPAAPAIDSPNSAPALDGAPSSPLATPGELAYVRARIERKGLSIDAALAKAALPPRTALEGLTRAEFAALIAVTA